MAKKKKKAAKTRTKRTAPKAAKKHIRVKKSKKPKRPKKSASLTAWENYDRRMSDWHRRHQEKISEERRRLTIMNKHC